MTKRNNARVGLNPGTATRPKGKETVKAIIAAAREVLSNEPTANFTMRRIAAGAGIYLRNLQYYFPSREAVIRALSETGGQEYYQKVEKALNGVGDDPLERFVAAINVYIRDNIHNKNQRKYNVRIISLLHSLDDFEGQMLSRYYSDQFVNRLTELIKDVNHQVGDGEALQRAKMIASLLDGLMLFSGPFNALNESLENYGNAVRVEVVKLATNQSQ